MDILYFPKLGWEFKLNKTAFNLFGMDIQWYAVLIAIGAALAFIYILERSREFGLHPDRVLDCVLGGIIGGIVGARVYYVIFQWDLYKDDLISIFNTRQGGLAIYGGIIGGLLVGYLMSKWRKVNFFPLFDLAGLGFLIGQAIGRWGNFFNMEAFGSNTDMPWGMTSKSIQQYLQSVQGSLAVEGIIVDPLKPVHPCFFYESMWCVLGLVLLNSYRKKRKFDGEIFLMYLAWYGTGRFFIEGMRTDSLMIGSLRVSQLLSALLVVVTVIIIVVTRGKIKRSNDPDFMPLYVNTEESEILMKEIDVELAQKDKESKQKKLDRKKNKLDKDDTVD